MTRRSAARTARDQARRAGEVIPIPRHPYRDSAIFYAILAGAVVGVTYATGGGLLRAFLVAGGFFVVATAFSWWRFRQKLVERAGLEEEGSGGP